MLIIHDVKYKEVLQITNSVWTCYAFTGTAYMHKFFISSFDGMQKEIKLLRDLESAFYYNLWRKEVYYFYNGFHVYFPYKFFNIHPQKSILDRNKKRGKTNV